MMVFRSALENEADKKEGQSVDALYVFTSGVPDQFKVSYCVIYCVVINLWTINVMDVTVDDANCYLIRLRFLSFFFKKKNIKLC